jgi:DNA-directed RNA polymerase subunit RPC12/RpoP
MGPKCKVCGSMKVSVDQDGKPVRCANCGWTRNKVRKAPA